MKNYTTVVNKREHYGIKKRFRTHENIFRNTESYVSYSTDGANWLEIWAQTKTYPSDQRSLIRSWADRIAKLARVVQPC